MISNVTLIVSSLRLIVIVMSESFEQLSGFVINLIGLAVLAVLAG